MAERHVARGDDGPAVDGREGHGGVVDDPVDGHRGHVLLHWRAVGGDLSDLPGELVLPLQLGLGRMDLHLVQFHAISFDGAPTGAPGAGRERRAVRGPGWRKLLRT